MTHLAVHVAGALQPDRIADLLDRERRGNRHDELPGNNRRRDAFQRPGVASQSPVTPSPTSSTTPAMEPEALSTKPPYSITSSTAAGMT
jgi:hypothetical protein